MWQLRLCTRCGVRGGAGVGVRVGFQGEACMAVCEVLGLQGGGVQGTQLCGGGGGVVWGGVGRWLENNGGKLRR